jgi:zinc transport system ATP-binding protein
MSLITCKNVAFDYEGRVVVSGLTFAVEKGDSLCIVGENGSGKSTLMKGLLRLKRPREGEIVFGEGLTPSQIGYLPQQTAPQKDFPGGVFEVVLSGRLGNAGWRPFFTKKDKAIARHNLELLGIASLEKACYRELSGGQQQRVLLARALCATQTLLLLDEPVAGLDPLVTADLYALIETINREMGVTIIMVSHDIGGAIKQASHILHLCHDGIFFGTPAEYVASDVGKRFIGGVGA